MMRDRGMPTMTNPFDSARNFRMAMVKRKTINVFPDPVGMTAKTSRPFRRAFTQKIC